MEWVIHEELCRVSSEHRHHNYLVQGYVEQDNLILNTTKGQPRLRDLYMRPVIGSRRIQVRLCQQ